MAVRQSADWSASRQCSPLQRQLRCRGDTFRWQNTPDRFRVAQPGRPAVVSRSTVASGGFQHSFPSPARKLNAAFFHIARQGKAGPAVHLPRQYPADPQGAQFFEYVCKPSQSKACFLPCKICNVQPGCSLRVRAGCRYSERSACVVISARSVL
jgi:hypothetical protein